MVINMGWDYIWQTIMVSIGTVNLLIAFFQFFRLMKWETTEPHNAKYFLLLRVLELIFISVALYRTVFVSSYPDRLAWFDTILNSPFIIRCLAVFAEMSFIGMIAAVLLKMCRDIVHISGVDKPLGLILPKLPFVAVGSIFVAQFFAFTGLITQYVTPFAIEESLWALAFLSITPVVIVGLKNLKNLAKGFKVFLIIMIVWCCGYLVFQCFYALPFMYFAELTQDVGKSIPYEAVRQAIFGYITTRDFNTWGGIGFLIWHSGYFSLCSWMVLFFMSAPRRVES